LGKPIALGILLALKNKENQKPNQRITIQRESKTPKQTKIKEQGKSTPKLDR
jgi:hypothetical protein